MTGSGFARDDSAVSDQRVDGEPVHPASSASDFSDLQEARVSGLPGKRRPLRTAA
jgi:hypothetical protein